MDVDAERKEGPKDDSQIFMLGNRWTAIRQRIQWQGEELVELVPQKFYCGMHWNSESTQPIEEYIQPSELRAWMLAEMSEREI